MDLSKLPKFSQTQQPHAPARTETNDAPAPAPVARAPHCVQCGLPLRPGARFCDACGAPTAVDTGVPPGNAADAWISAIIGFIFLIIGKNFGAYLFSLITRQPYHTGVNWVSGDKAGTEVAYPDLEGFVIWTDSAMFIFGIALLLEAAALLGSRAQIRLA
jgi:hypothetical protein